MGLKGFISYAHDERRLAGSIKQELSNFGIDCFLAHEDIEPSVEWQSEIVKCLRECDIFFPLISNKFRESMWADQEVGMAVVLGGVSRLVEGWR